MKPGELKYPRSPLGEREEGIPTGRDVSLGFRWIIDVLGCLKPPFMELSVGRMVTR